MYTYIMNLPRATLLQFHSTTVNFSTFAKKGSRLLNHNVVLSKGSILLVQRHWFTLLQFEGLAQPG